MKTSSSDLMEPTQQFSRGIKSYPVEEAIAMETALVKIRAALYDIPPDADFSRLIAALKTITQAMPNDQRL